MHLHGVFFGPHDEESGPSDVRIVGLSGRFWEWHDPEDHTPGPGPQPDSRPLTHPSVAHPSVEDRPDRGDEGHGLIEGEVVAGFGDADHRGVFTHQCSHEGDDLRGDERAVVTVDQRDRTAGAAR